MIAWCLSLDYLGGKSMEIDTPGLFGELQNYNDQGPTVVIQNSRGVT